MCVGRGGFKPGAAAERICGDSLQGDRAWLEEERTGQEADA